MFEESKLTFKMSLNSISKLASIFFFAMLLSFCSTKKTEPNVRLQFTHRVDDSSLVLHQMDYSNPAGNNYSVMRLKYLVSNIQLHDIAGNSILLSDVHFVDVEQESSSLLNTETIIPSKTYSSISFTLGLDGTSNTSEAYLNKAFHGAMIWPEIMGGGYHYMKLEGKYLREDGSTPFYNIHTGKLNDVSHHINYNIPLEFFANSDDITLSINMNINHWLGTPNSYNFEIFTGGIMGNEEAQTTLMENGNNIFSISYE